MELEPILRIIGRTTIDLGAIESFLREQKITWEKDTTASDSEALVEFAGRICYMSFGTKQSSISNDSFIKDLIHQGHNSVLEHATWTFILSGVSRAFSHQLVRHRIGFSFSQLSQQYVNHSQIEFVEPNELSKYPEAKEHWHQAIESIRKAYKHIANELEDNIPKNIFSSKREFYRLVRSIARSILPNATETVIVFTANARAICHFLRVRGDIEGDIEMRKVAAELLRLMQEEVPSVFSDFKIEFLKDGSPIIRYNSPSHTS